MSVNEEVLYPWLKAEKRLILQAVESGKTVLGICLGAQLIASAAGARVFPNRCKEIGWFPVRPAGSRSDSHFPGLFAGSHEVFHWHGDTFDLPRGSVRLLESDACENQAFSLGSRVLGLQFHLETTPQSAASLIENSRAEIVPSRTIQTEAEMLARPERFAAINRLMDSLLSALSGEADAHAE
jgi:GMP synthase-like glutamine amidotransferase